MGEGWWGVWRQRSAACRLLIIIAVHRAGKEPVQRVIRLQKDGASERDSHCNGTLQRDQNMAVGVTGVREPRKLHMALETESRRSREDG